MRFAVLEYGETKFATRILNFNYANETNYI